MEILTLTFTLVSYRSFLIVAFFWPKDVYISLSYPLSYQLFDSFICTMLSMSNTKTR